MHWRAKRLERAVSSSAHAQACVAASVLVAPKKNASEEALGVVSDQPKWQM
jgi:hypothetical protein